ncbi:MAG TPA: patatin-like phospholipase family protein, partial [Bryobacteraceae bacterium]
MPIDRKHKTFDVIVAEELKILRPPFVDGTPDERPLSALCISGGGIRSATFALGAIQGLAAQGVLPEFDYLSTVSGGGYIGAWLTSWKQRAGGLKNIAPNLCAGGPPPNSGATDPIDHLREYNNYLSPQLSVFSADTWTLGATVIRNIALNWLVLIPLLMFALMMPRLILSLACLGDTIGNFYGVTAPATLALVVEAIPIVGGLFFAI